MFRLTNSVGVLQSIFVVAISVLILRQLQLLLVLRTERESTDYF